MLTPPLAPPSPPNPHLHLLCLRAPWGVFMSKLITNGGEYLQWSLRVIYHQAPPSLFDSAAMLCRSRGALVPYFSIFIRYVTRRLRTELKQEHGEWNGRAAQGGWQICSAISSFNILFLSSFFFLKRNVEAARRIRSGIISIHQPSPSSTTLSLSLFLSLLFYLLFSINSRIDYVTYNAFCGCQ